LATDSRLRDALFSPRTIALVGASADLKKNNSRTQRFLRNHGYSGRILPINPGRDEIFGEKAYADLRSAPGPIDHAFVMVPGAAVPDVIAQCCELGIPVATIFSAGFAELGTDGLQRQRDMVAMARTAGVRLLGPNCMGLMNVTGATMLTVNAVVELEKMRPGCLSMVSQSGSMTGSVLARAQARGLGFSKLISVGNECDLGVGEITDLLVDDPDTKAILLFLETFRDAAALANAARRAVDAGKPVIAYKLGRSSVGRAAATSHTGAMTGPDELASAFFRAHGILRVETMEGLFETPQLVLGHQPPKGKRVAVLTGTGGAAAMIVDRLGVIGAEVVGPPPQVIAQLQTKGIAVSDAPLTDIPMGGSTRGRYAAVLSALLASDHCDAVVSVIGSSAQSDPQVIVERVLEAQHRDAKPLAVFLAPRADEALLRLQAQGVAAFRTPESCADAVNAYLNWHQPASKVDADDVSAAESFLRDRVPGVLNERDSSALFSALGVPVVESVVVARLNECVDRGHASAVKLLSADIPHKTDAGMVRLDVKGHALQAVVADLLADAKRRFPAAKIDGVLVQRMEKGLAEVIVGYKNNAEVGPVVLLGMGGVMAELRKSFCVRMAPVSLERAREMIAEVPELALLRGYRNLPRGDCEALARAIRAVSMLACLKGGRVKEAEINPLMVKAEGVVAVDGLVTLA
jgi:acyl-CoA synthetase (NDP forming)